MQRVFVASAGLALILTTAAHSQTPAAVRLRAGAAKADFTPKQSDLATATDSIRDHLYARAIVVDDGPPAPRWSGSTWDRRRMW